PPAGVAIAARRSAHARLQDRGRGLALPAAIAAGAGLLHALAFAPANLPWLELVALGVCFGLALRANSARCAFAIGLTFGVGWFGVGVSWVYISLHHYGGLWPWLAALATGGLVAFLALYPALALAAAATIGARATARRMLAIVAAWTLSEWLRGIVLGGLPWLSTGYAHTDGPLAGYAPLVGVYGVGAAAALVMAAPLWAWFRTDRTVSMALAGTLASVALLGAGQLLRERTWSQAHGAPMRVRLVQGNIAQDLKFGEGGLERALARYLPALQVEAGSSDPRAHPDLIVLPESAFPVAVNDLPEEVLDALMDARRRQGAALIFGAFIVEPDERYFNSAIGLDGEAARPQRYSKRHLVPFGEFIPFGFRWFVDLMRIPIGDQQRGERFQPPMALAGQQVAVNICFEDLFGAQLLDAWHDPQRAPTVLLNLSNLAWFDDSLALPQHLQISRMRALETARPVLLATNTGVTAIIDARGQVISELPVQTAGILEGTVQATQGTTPFIRTANWPIVIGSVLVLLAVAFVRQRAGQSSAEAPVQT
ncbi:MAG TPA: apolipoprotein N-acyltransferase, partial [Burkholderiaceae bacterium]|nr:apolipoprotein N-acyltransferase [Burkholderiaceae bacterium]